jgi:hypothetical protein
MLPGLSINGDSVRGTIEEAGATYEFFSDKQEFFSSMNVGSYYEMLHRLRAYTDSMTRTQHVDNDDTFIEDEELTDEDRDSPNLGDPGFRG